MSDRSDTINTILAGISALVGIIPLLVAYLKLQMYRRRLEQRAVHYSDVFELEVQNYEVCHVPVSSCNILENLTRDH